MEELTVQEHLENTFLSQESEEQEKSLNHF